MRLIDADALKKTFENLRRDSYYEPIFYDHTVQEVIDNAPTVEERPKSKWWFSEGEWKCMNCGSELESEDITPFCPMCGADMRGDEE